MKKTVSFLTAAMLTAAMGASASASGISQSVDAIEANHDSINIIYNGQLMTYTDAIPENINDRVMLPFRAVLEGMGATVNYEDASRLVTASRGNITLTFTLEDDTIYINNNGVNSELKLDVPMIIKNDRTLVPIRFISNALGMQVGWEGDYNTVLIVDDEAYQNDIAENAPNVTKVLSSDTAYTTSSVSGTAEVKLKDIEVSGTIEGIAVDDKVYLKTDLADKLLGDGASDKWYYIDINALLVDSFGFAGEGDATLESAIMADAMADTYKALDKYITIDGDKITLSIKTADMVNLLKSMDVDAETAESIIFDAFAESEYGEDGVTSKANIKFGVKIDADEYMITLDMSGSANDDGSVTVPANAEDLMQVIQNLIK